MLTLDPCARSPNFQGKYKEMEGVLRLFHSIVFYSCLFSAALWTALLGRWPSPSLFPFISTLHQRGTGSGELDASETEVALN